MMALSIRNPDVARLAREVARETGENMTEAILCALEERLERLSTRPPAPSLAERLDRIQTRVAELPVLDPRTPDEILGYNDTGLPS
jgi:antitoxin VapB